MPYLPDLTAVLVDGATFAGDGEEYVLAPYALGTVTLPTGRVVGCDPLVDAANAEPFTVTVTPGDYHLRAWVAEVRRDGTKPQQRTAALQLIVTDQPAVRWSAALTPGQDPAQLADDDFFGYPVDAGAGALADVVALRALAAWDYERLDEVFIPARMPDAPAALGAITDDATGANVVTVSTGWGDGLYPTFVGHAADGTVTAFVTDFLVVPPAD